MVEASRCTAASAAAPPASSRLGPARQPQGARACEPSGGPRPDAGGCSAGLETAAASCRAQVRKRDRPEPPLSWSGHRCQGDRRRTFPRWAPPPGQSYQRSPESRFSLFRCHFRPRTGGSAATADGPSTGGLWDGVGPGRWREGARPGAGGREWRQAVLKLADRARGEAPNSPTSRSPPGRLEPGGGGCAVRSPTAAGPGVLRDPGGQRLLRCPRLGPRAG